MWFHEANINPYGMQFSVIKVKINIAIPCLLTNIIEIQGATLIFIRYW